MIVNGNSLYKARPVLPMFSSKMKKQGVVSYGMSETGYDIRVLQDILFQEDHVYVDGKLQPNTNKFCIASSVEYFRMPNNLAAIVHDKSTWARQGLSVFNTVIEPGWKGFLTLELVYHGKKDLHIPANSGIAQVVFHQVTDESEYTGKYQNQPNEPVPSIWEGESHD